MDKDTKICIMAVIILLIGAISFNLSRTNIVVNKIIIEEDLTKGYYPHTAFVFAESEEYKISLYCNEFKNHLECDYDYRTKIGGYFKKEDLECRNRDEDIGLCNYWYLSKTNINKIINNLTKEFKREEVEVCE